MVDVLGVQFAFVSYWMASESLEATSKVYARRDVTENVPESSTKWRECSASAQNVHIVQQFGSW